MEWLDRCTAEFEKQRAALNRQIEMLQSGQTRTPDWEDTAAGSLDVAKNDLAQIELLLAEYAKCRP